MVLESVLRIEKQTGDSIGVCPHSWGKSKMNGTSKKEPRSMHAAQSHKRQERLSLVTVIFKEL